MQHTGLSQSVQNICASGLRSFITSSTTDFVQQWETQWSLSRTFRFHKYIKLSQVLLHCSHLYKFTHSWRWIWTSDCGLQVVSFSSAKTNENIVSFVSVAFHPEAILKFSLTKKQLKRMSTDQDWKRTKTQYKRAVIFQNVCSGRKFKHTKPMVA